MTGRDNLKCVDDMELNSKGCVNLDGASIHLDGETSVSLDENTSASLDENTSVSLDETSFLPPHDDRMYVSGVCDIDGGDNFVEYAEWFWETYGGEIYDDIDL